MNQDEIETYFLWLTEEEQSDLFNHADRSGVSSLICESVMEQHESLSSDYEYVEKPVTEYSTNENMHVPNMHPEPANVATTYSYNQDMISPNLYYNPPDINHPYQTMNQNATEFNPMYYENPSKDVTPVNSFAVPSTVIDTPSEVPSTMNYMESNTPSVIEYSNVPSLSNEMEHIPSNPIQNYTVPTPTEMQSPSVLMDNDGPSEDLNMVSVLLNVPLEQLNDDTVPGQQELSAESIDFSGVPTGMSMIPNDTNLDFNHERLNALNNDDSNITNEYQPTLDPSEYHDDSSRSMVIDEDPPQSENYEAADQTMPENVDVSDCAAMAEGRALSPACVTNEITIDESQPNNSTEEISAVEDEPKENKENNAEQEESSSRTEPEDESCEVTNQVNGTIYDVENEMPIVQMCIRTGCVNPAVNNPEWEQEFCSNDCVVIHCRNVFNGWVEANAVMSQ